MLTFGMRPSHSALIRAHRKTPLLSPPWNDPSSLWFPISSPVQYSIQAASWASSSTSYAAFFATSRSVVSCVTAKDLGRSICSWDERRTICLISAVLSVWNRAPSIVRFWSAKWTVQKSRPVSVEMAAPDKVSFFVHVWHLKHALCTVWSKIVMLSAGYADFLHTCGGHTRGGGGWEGRGASGMRECLSP